MQLGRTAFLSTAALLLGVIPLVVAHGDDGVYDMAAPGAHVEHGMEMSANASVPVTMKLPSYFTHPEYTAWLYAHIALMTVGWVVVLPLGKAKPKNAI